MCCRHGNLRVPVQPRLRLREAWATEEEVQWPGIKGRRSMLGLAGSLRGWGVGSCPPRNLTLLGVGEGQRCLTLEDLAEGHCPRLLPVNWATWVSLGLEAREMWVQILHPHLLLWSPWDHHLTPEFSILSVETGRVIRLPLQGLLERSETTSCEAGPLVLTHPLLSP